MKKGVFLILPLCERAPRTHFWRTAKSTCSFKRTKRISYPLAFLQLLLKRLQALLLLLVDSLGRYHYDPLKRFGSKDRPR